MKSSKDDDQNGTDADHRSGVRNRQQRKNCDAKKKKKGNLTKLHQNSATQFFHVTIRERNCAAKRNRNRPHDNKIHRQIARKLIGAENCKKFNKKPFLRSDLSLSANLTKIYALDEESWLVRMKVPRSEGTVSCLGFPYPSPFLSPSHYTSPFPLLACG